MAQERRVRTADACDEWPGTTPGSIAGSVADALIKCWRTGDGREYIAAVTCLDAIQSDSSPKLARAALMRAAEEAGITAIAIV
ncbi:DUF982 domain-containing protein [Rhizobium bangladeshense]|uniref:DUF982 domain-containing protein n=1 Tax=Rhizobium bangladeshense TaxID=1138189 RepID=UPI0032AFF4D0